MGVRYLSHFPQTALISAFILRGGYGDIMIMKARTNEFKLYSYNMTQKIIEPTVRNERRSSWRGRQ